MANLWRIRGRKNVAAINLSLIIYHRRIYSRRSDLVRSTQSSQDTNN